MLPAARTAPVPPVSLQVRKVKVLRAPKFDINRLMEVGAGLLLWAAALGCCCCWGLLPCAAWCRRTRAFAIHQRSPADQPHPASPRPPPPPPPTRRSTATTPPRPLPPPRPRRLSGPLRRWWAWRRRRRPEPEPAASLGPRRRCFRWVGGVCARAWDLLHRALPSV